MPDFGKIILKEDLELLIKKDNNYYDDVIFEYCENQISLKYTNDDGFIGLPSEHDYDAGHFIINDYGLYISEDNEYYCMCCYTENLGIEKEISYSSADVLKFTNFIEKLYKDGRIKDSLLSVVYL